MASALLQNGDRPTLLKLSKNMIVINRNLFIHPLADASFIEINGTTKETINSWAFASLALYEACIGNVKAQQLVSTLLSEANPILNISSLLSRCKLNEEAAIRQAICLIANQIDERTRRAFEH